MKKILSLVFALSLGASAFAEDYSLYYDSAEGTLNNVLGSVARIQKLTFENGNVVLTFKDGTRRNTAISGIKRMFFSSPEALDVRDLEAEKDEFAKKGVYDLTGRKVADSMNADIPKGIYIADGKKVMVK